MWQEADLAREPGCWGLQHQLSMELLTELKDLGLEASI